MISLKDIKENHEKGYISIRNHPFVDLYILNYTVLASSKAIWNEVTLNSRGLIIDKAGKIIALPFRKFFEVEQLRPELIPQKKPIKIYEKLDGTLGIMYWFNNKPYISTRGSFTSYQAIRATEVLYKKYSSSFSALKQDYTYLFEIIIPDSRIVLDYGQTEELFLIGVVDNTTQEEIAPENITDNPFPLPRQKQLNQYSSLKQLQKNIKNDIEGYVLVYEDNFRIKVKSEHYKVLFNFYTVFLKRYAIEKALNDNYDANFEKRLSKNDTLWLDYLTEQTLLLKDNLKEEAKDSIKSSSKNIGHLFQAISERILSNQFYKDTLLFESFFQD